MKHLLLTTIAAVVLVGCGESQQSRQWSEADRALFAAADEGNIEAVKKAIAAGADVNAKGDTPVQLIRALKNAAKSSAGVKMAGLV